jgi:hypothetical protein
MMLGVIGGRGVDVKDAVAVQPIVHGPMRAHQDHPHPLIDSGFSPCADGVEIGQRPFDLLQDGQRVGRGEEGCALEFRS